MQHPLTRPLVLCFATVLAIVVVAARAQNPQAPNQEQIDRQRAVDFVRAINTAEYQFRNEQGRFGSWNEISQRVWKISAKRRAENPEAFAATPDEQAGAEPHSSNLEVIASADGMKYSVALTDSDTRTQGCGFSLFSDQSGLVYQGTVIDCPHIVDAPDVRNR